MIGITIQDISILAITILVIIVRGPTGVCIRGHVDAWRCRKPHAYKCFQSGCMQASDRCHIGAGT